jgi:hypothetical protein
MDFAGKQQERAEEETEQDRPRHVRIVHHVLVHGSERVQHRKCLLPTTHIISTPPAEREGGSEGERDAQTFPLM